METKKNLRKMALIAAIVMAIFMSSSMAYAQLSGFCGTPHCIENNTDCTITVDVDILCKGSVCQTYSGVTILSKTC